MRGSRKKRTNDEGHDDGRSYKQWLQDFYSGYEYDPDGVQIDIDMSKSGKDVLHEIDEDISYFEFMDEKEREKLVSRLIQWKERVDYEAGARILKLLSFYG